MQNNVLPSYFFSSNQKLFVFSVFLKLFLVNIWNSSAQTQLPATVIKNNGDTIKIVAKLRTNNHYKIIFPDELESNYFDCKVEGSKTKIQKSEIDHILVTDGSRFDVMRYGSNFMIGTYMLTPDMKIFKVYALQRTKSYGQMGSTGYASSTSVNKVVIPKYFIEGSQGQLSPADIPRDVRKLSKNCPAMKKYLSKKKVRKPKQFEKALEYYSTRCDSQEEPNQ